MAEQLPLGELLTITQVRDKKERKKNAFTNPDMSNVKEWLSALERKMTFMILKDYVSIRPNNDVSYFP